MDFITEPEKKVKVRYKADLFVAGGSCTGVFAAVRAARRGLHVVIAERQNCLGGTATSALVNVWHSLKDAEYKEQIIFGLTDEITNRLVKGGNADLVDHNPSTAVVFNPFYLEYELDKLVKEEKITVLLHTLCVGAVCDGKKITHAIIENKDGRSAVEASFYIDATGDGDLAHYLGMSEFKNDVVQPPTPCFLMRGNISGPEIWNLVSKHCHEYGLDDDFGWDSGIPGLADTTMQADFHVFGKDAASGEGLTEIEIRGREHAFRLVKLINENSDKKVSVAGLSSAAGIRESRHFKTFYKATKEDLLSGKKFDDCILRGTYRLDTHYENGDTETLYLDGTAVRMSGASRRTTVWNWREKGLVKLATDNPALYYEVPFGLLVQNEYDNIILAGRMLNGDREAFGALRVMVNLNQLGEAAGVACAVALEQNCKICELDGNKVSSELYR